MSNLDDSEYKVGDVSFLISNVACDPKEQRVTEEKTKKKKRKREQKEENVSVPELREDVQVSKKSKKKKKKEVEAVTDVRDDSDDGEDYTGPVSEDQQDRESRTIFVGNLPVDAKKSKVKNMFKKYGVVESVRFRGAAVADLRIPKKVAVIKKQLHSKRNSIHAYVRFTDKASAVAALDKNGHEFDDEHILRVDLAKRERADAHKASVFVGNVPFDVEDSDLRRVFDSCGDIESIRIVRDSVTGLGRGFAYVNFTSSDGVQLALELNDHQMNGRPLRVKPYKPQHSKTTRNKPQVSHTKQKQSMKPVHTNPETSFAGKKVTTKQKKSKQKTSARKTKLTEILNKK